MTTDEVIGANCHELMWRKRVKQSEMCEAMGLSRSSLNKKLRGQVAWSAQDIDKAARFLGEEPGRLFAVAGAGFEPATSGPRASILHLPARGAPRYAPDTGRRAPVIALRH
jgi:transcriptional regulator with XRE-family HTH domain